MDDSDTARLRAQLGYVHEDGRTVVPVPWRVDRSAPLTVFASRVVKMMRKMRWPVTVQYVGDGSFRVLLQVDRDADRMLALLQTIAVSEAHVLRIRPEDVRVDVDCVTLLGKYRFTKHGHITRG